MEYSINSLSEIISVARKNLVISYHALDWPSPPVFEEKGIFVAVSGWFVFRGQLCNLSEFGYAFYDTKTNAEIKTILNEITDGAYLFYIHHHGIDYIITDPFGLHPHYYKMHGSKLIAAPSPWFIKDEKEQKDPLLSSILKRKNHLFGNYTAYSEILRFEPGAIIHNSNGSFKHGHNISYFFDYTKNENDIEDAVLYLTKQFKFFNDRKKILPLSGGLDSRLILSAGQFDYGYTFGPKNTGDRITARNFSDRFTAYQEFSLLEKRYEQRFKVAAFERIFDGITHRPFAELLVVYKDLYENWGTAVFFDGYLGDAMYRGAYFTYKGIIGSISKAFPFLTFTFMSDKNLLRKRYKEIGDEGNSLLITTYEEKMKRFTNLDIWHKMQLFEIIYGRGARYIINGGKVMSNQYFTSVQPFFSVPVFRRFFNIDAKTNASCGAYKQIWKKTANEYFSVLTVENTKPLWPSFMIRLIRLLMQGLARTGIYKKSNNYKIELPLIKWV